VSEQNGTSEERLRMLVSLAYLAGVAWLMMPEHKRQLLIMRVTVTARAAATELARRAGVASMRNELDTGRQVYTVPYLLSRARDRLGRAYDAARGA
jgi:hypothetical protein